jgi:hypothetical protein
MGWEALGGDGIHQREAAAWPAGRSFVGRNLPVARRRIGQTCIGGTGTGFETGANWSTGSAPTFAQTGTFGASANTSVSMTVPSRRTAVFSSMPERRLIRST